MLALLALISVASVPPSLDAIFKGAAAHAVFAVRPEKRATARYLSLHGFSEADRPRAMIALNMAVNGASFGGEVVRLEAVEGLLVPVDLDSLRWSKFLREAELDRLEKLGVKFAFKKASDKEFFADIWETLAFHEPFFRPEYHPLAPWVSKFSHSRMFILSAHWLFPKLMLERQDGGFYSQLLLLPPVEKDLYKRLGVPIEFAEIEPRGIHGAAVVKSASVAYNPRELQFLPSGTGYDLSWLARTKDFIKADRRDKDVRQSPANTAVHDGREVLFSLPNGFEGGYLANGAGAQVNLVPQAIAEDQRDVLVTAGARRPDYSRTKSVVNFVKCIDCHGESEGLIGFDDNIIRLIVPKRLDTGYLVNVKDYDDKAAHAEIERIEEFYRKGLPSKLAAYRASYAAQVRACTGLSVLEATRIVVQFYDRFTEVYAADLVTPEQAASEMAYPIEIARALWLASGDDQLGFLAGGQPITRIQWHLSVGKALALASKPLKKAG